MKTRILLGISVGVSGLLSGCGDKGAERYSQTLDVTSPVGGPVKSLIANLVLSPSLERLWTNYGYRSTSNCVQLISNQRSDGTTFETVELFSGPCRQYPVTATPQLRLRLRKDNSQTSIFTHWLIPFEVNGAVVSGTEPAGRISYAGGTARLENLCDLDFAIVCDVMVEEGGTIAGVQIKNVQPSTQGR